jgi:hypothetical protein
MIDTLKLAHALRDKGGFTQQTAEGTAEALNEAFTQSAATKADLAEIRSDLGGRIRAVEAKVTMVMWIVGLNLAATVAVLIKHW